MFVNPYDTSACAGYAHKLPAIQGQLERLLVLDNESLQKIPNDGGFALTPFDTTVAPFAHPLATSVGEQKRYVVDVRPFTRLDANKNVVISSGLDYKVCIERCVMQTRWYKEGSAAVLGLGNFQIKAFGEWISNALKMRYSLDPDAVLKIAVVSSYYYFCISDPTEDDSYSEDDLRSISMLIGNLYNISGSDAGAYIEGMPVIRSINSMIECIKTSVDSRRLDRMNIVDLYAVLGGSWFGGGNPRELIAVALEHPPTFVVMIKNALTERGYKRSMLAQLLLRYEKQNDTIAFLRSFDYFVYGA